MSRFLNERYAGFEAYTPGEQPRDMKYIKLNTNESPYPPSKGVIDAVNAQEIGRLMLYPDPECTELRDKIAALYGFNRENIYLSNGSDDILNFAFMAFTPQNRAVFPDISYGFYSVFAQLYGIDFERKPLKEDFSIDYRDYFNAGGMVVIANPNAPTGLMLDIKEIEEILKHNRDNVVVIDEAYIDFGGRTCAELIRKYDNLLVVQTFSKSRSMAGARLGFAIADEGLIADLNKIKYSTNPYNINRLTLAAGSAAIDDNDYYMNNCKTIEKTREYTTNELRALGFTVLDSKANFIFAKSGRIGGQELYYELKRRGILVRHFDAPRIREYNRITIGTPEQMSSFIETVKEIIR